jgi:light-regulated signal transduction histidine kinase (bacteriophytochrome)
VRERTRELELTVRELEAFSYSVSHDLRAPLRGIDGFSKILAEDYADKLDNEAARYLGRIRAGAQRMGAIIDDLLTLSRVTRGRLATQRVDLSAVAREVVEALREAEPERKVQVSIADDLVVEGDVQLLRLALENLLGNAWKFTRQEPLAQIAFDAKVAESGTVYRVRDNGVGFDMAHADKLFAAFQRLHDPDDFEGTGIGLATVRRIIERHGGRIWAEGAEGEGATFYFTLAPAASRRFA